MANPLTTHDGQSHHCSDGMRQLSAASGSDYAGLHGGVNVCEAERNRRRKFYCSSAIYA